MNEDNLPRVADKPNVIGVILVSLDEFDAYLVLNEIKCFLYDIFGLLICKYKKILLTKIKAISMIYPYYLLICR